MNSKQLNFFIIPADLSDVYAFFNRMDVKYVKMNKYQADGITLERFPFRDGTIYDQIYITHPEFGRKIYTRENELISEYRINLEKSYVLEFTPGGILPIRPHILKRARFYCTTSYFVSNGESVAKPDVFKKWVDKFFNAFKKEFLVKSQSPGNYFSHRTVEWMKETGAVVHPSFTQIEF